MTTNRSCKILFAVTRTNTTVIMIGVIGVKGTTALGVSNMTGMGDMRGMSGSGDGDGNGHGDEDAEDQQQPVNEATAIATTTSTTPQLLPLVSSRTATPRFRTSSIRSPNNTAKQT